jgi:hypothetical protein
MRSQENEDEDESSSSSSSSTSSAFDLAMRGPSNGFFWTRSTVDAHHCTGATFTFTALSTALAEPVAVMHVLKGASNQATDPAALLSSLMVNQQLLDAMPPIFARNRGSCIRCLPGCSSCDSGLLRCTACSGGFTRVTLSSLLSPPHGSPVALLLDGLAVCLPGMAVRSPPPPLPSRAVDSLSGPPGIQVRVLQPQPAPAPAPGHFDPVSVPAQLLRGGTPAAPAPLDIALELMPPPHAPAPAVAPVPLKWAPAPPSIPLGLVSVHPHNTAVVPSAGVIATVAAVSALGLVLLLLSCILAGRKQRRKVSNIIFIDADPESPGASCHVAKADKDTHHGMTL